MSAQVLSSEERDCLLQLARQSLTNSVTGRRLPPLDLGCVPPGLRQPGVTFVTLTIDGDLRGCVGALEAYQSLAEDVWEHTEAAALHDFRFPPVAECELPGIHIEISALSHPEPLAYETPQELLERLRPGVDGVIIRDGPRRATFLPQVWEKLPDPLEFLGYLCAKMGAPASLWRRKHLEVFTYRVELFEERQPGRLG